MIPTALSLLVLHVYLWLAWKWFPKRCSKWDDEARKDRIARKLPELNHGPMWLFRAGIAIVFGLPIGWFLCKWAAPLVPLCGGFLFSHEFRSLFNTRLGRLPYYLGIGAWYDRYWLRKAGMVKFPETSAEHWRLYTTDEVYMHYVWIAGKRAIRFEKRGALITYILSLLAGSGYILMNTW